MCDIADTVEDGVAHDGEIAVIRLTENPHHWFRQVLRLATALRLSGPVTKCPGR
jgi:hypothetical protein